VLSNLYIYIAEKNALYLMQRSAIVGWFGKIKKAMISGFEFL